MCPRNSICLLCGVRGESGACVRVFPCFDVDVNGCRVCVQVRVGVLCGNEGPVVFVCCVVCAVKVERVSAFFRVLMWM